MLKKYFQEKGGSKDKVGTSGLIEQAFKEVSVEQPLEVVVHGDSSG